MGQTLHAAGGTQRPACLQSWLMRIDTTDNAEMEPLRQWKTAQHQSRRQENFLLSVERPARPKRRILLEHRPDFALDPVINSGIENNHPAQDIRASGWKIRANRGLNVPRPEALRGCEGGSQDGVAQPVWGSARRERTTKKESHKVVAFALGCRKRPELHLPREISKSIRGLRLMYEVTRGKYSHFKACCRDDF